MNARSGSSAQQQQQQQQQQILRSTSMNAAFAGQPSSASARPPPRLQNTQKTGLGNGAGWGGFGMPVGSGGAFGGLGAAPGLSAQPRPGQLSGFAQVMGGGGAQGPIDMSDFPSLSGGQRAPPNNSTTANWNSSAIRQPSSQHPAQLNQPQQRAPSAAPSQQSIDQTEGQRAQQPSSDRAGSGDDFPPLGGQMNGDALGSANGFNSSMGSPDQPQARVNGPPTQLPIRESSGGYPPPQQSLLGHPLSQTQSQSTQGGQPSAPPPSNVKKYGDMTEDEKWGLPGLMAAFESRRQAETGGQPDETLPAIMRSAVMMGQDISTLGMELDSSEPLYPTFTPFPAPNSSNSAYDFHDRLLVPDFTLPSAYTVTNVPPLTSRLSAFSDETLFSVFYQHPRDVLQELSAHELVSRDWRWHKVLRQWLQKDTRDAHTNSSLPLVDLSGGLPVGAASVRTGDHSERGVYIFFDAMNWRRERREFNLDYDQLDDRGLTALTAAGGAGGAAPTSNGGPPALATGQGMGGAAGLSSAAAVAVGPQGA